MSKHTSCHLRHDSRKYPLKKSYLWDSINNNQRKINQHTAIKLVNLKEKIFETTWDGEDCCMRWRRLEVDCTAWQIWSAAAAFALPSLIPPPPPPTLLAVAIPSSVDEQKKESIFFLSCLGFSNQRVFLIIAFDLSVLSYQI